jgi:hypothetical protein
MFFDLRVSYSTHTVKLAVCRQASRWLPRCLRDPPVELGRRLKCTKSRQACAVQGNAMM